MLLEGHVQLFGPLLDIPPIKSPDEGLILLFFLDAFGLNLSNIFARSDQRHRRDEAHEFIYREKSPRHRRLPGNIQILGMAEDRRDHLIRASFFLENLTSDSRVLLRGRNVFRSQDREEDRWHPIRPHLPQTFGHRPASRPQRRGHATGGPLPGPTQIKAPRPRDGQASFWLQFKYSQISASSSQEPGFH